VLHSSIVGKILALTLAPGVFLKRTASNCEAHKKWTQRSWLVLSRYNEEYEGVGFEPRLSNEINKLEGANGTSNLHNSTKIMNSTFILDA
jgi:hypothetical protein